MEKRMINGIIALTLLLSFLAIPANAAEMNSRKTEDALFSASAEARPWCQATPFRNEADDAQTFSYNIPEDGVTVLIFFEANAASGQAVKAFAESAWMESDKLNVVMLECAYAKRETIRNFLDSYAGENQRYFNVYYTGERTQTADIPKLLNAYEKLLNFPTGNYRLSSDIPLVLFITEENGEKMIQYALRGPFFNETYPKALAEFLDKDSGPELTRRHLKDAAVAQMPERTVYKGFSLSDDTNAEREFSYSVPPGGVTFMMFFTTSCPYSAQAFRRISESAWAKSPNVNMIAVEISGADKESVRSFVRSNAGRTSAGGDSQKDLFEVYYYPGAGSWPSNAVKSMAHDYAELLTGGTSIPTPFCMVIQEENGKNYIMRNSFQLYEAEAFASAISTLTDIDWEDSAQAVHVEAFGKKQYGVTAEVVSLVNKERSKAGLSPLRQGSFLTDEAMTRATEISIFYDHVRPNGENFSSVLNFRHENVAVGENIAYGYASAQEVVEAWMSSPGHQANILNPNYAEIGVGSFASGGNVYWVQIFSGNRDQPEPEAANMTDIPARNYAVSSLKRHLHTEISGLDFPAALRIGQSAEVRFVNVNESNGAKTLLLPSVSAVKATDNSALTVAEVSVNAERGIVTVTPVAEGIGKLELKAYDEESNPASVFLNAYAFSAPTSIANVSRNQHSVTAAIFCENAPATVLCAVYGAGGRLLSVRAQTIAGSGNYEFQFDDETFDNANVFVFDAYQKPLCENKRAS